MFFIRINILIVHYVITSLYVSQNDAVEMCDVLEPLLDSHNRDCENDLLFNRISIHKYIP